MAAVAGARRGSPDADGARMNLYAGQTRRIQLNEISWIEHTPGSLGLEHAKNSSPSSSPTPRGSSATLDGQPRVIEPRLTGEYNDLADAPHPALGEAADVLSAHYQVRYDGLWINFYRDHRDSTGWHGDWPTAGLEQGQQIAVTVGEHPPCATASRNCACHRIGAGGDWLAVARAARSASSGCSCPGWAARPAGLAGCWRRDCGRMLEECLRGPARERDDVVARDRKSVV